MFIITYIFRVGMPNEKIRYKNEGTACKASESYYIILLHT